MNDKLIDLIYATRSLCETLREKFDLLEDEELIDYLEEVEELLDELSSIDGVFEIS